MSADTNLFDVAGSLEILCKHGAKVIGMLLLKKAVKIIVNEVEELESLCHTLCLGIKVVFLYNLSYNNDVSVDIVVICLPGRDVGVFVDKGDTVNDGLCVFVADPFSEKICTRLVKLEGVAESFESLLVHYRTVDNSHKDLACVIIMLLHYVGAEF